MIDKSIRQHYSTGDEVKKFGYEAGQKLISPLKNKYIAQDTGKIKKTEIAKDIGINLAKKAVARKLGLASLNPILGLLSLFGFKPFKTLTEGGVKQAFTAGMTGTQADYETARELRQLEKRRDYMLHRRDVLGKKISEKNLEEVTNRINTIKKTAPVTVTDYEGEAYGTPDTIKDILDKQYEYEDKKTAPLRIPKTPEVIIPHLEGDRTIPTPTLTTDFAFEDTKRAAQEEAEKQAAFDRAVAENAAKAAAEAAAQRAYAARVPDRIYGGGNDGNQGGGGGGQAAADAAGGSAYSSPFKKGGRVRDI